MKRRFKLISSIASFTAAIALLVFGVYAATTRQVTVGGTVSFTSVGVDAKVNVYEGYGAASVLYQENTGTEQDPIMKGEHVFSTASGAGNYKQDGFAYTELGVAYPLGDEINMGTVESPNLQQQYVYSYKVEIENTGDKVMYVKIVFTEDELISKAYITKGYEAKNGAGEAINNVANAAAMTTLMANVAVAADAKLIFTVTYTVNPVLVDINEWDWDFLTTFDLATTSWV